MKPLLLDTQVLLWLLGDPDRVPPTVATAVGDPRADVVLSAVVFWEVAIKSGLGKLKVSESFRVDVEAYGYRALPVNAEHGWAVRSLAPHHRDPFDRMLVAQAQIEGAAIVTADPQIARYDVPVLWA